jgi:ABC-type sulfate transport system permease component
MIGRTVEAAFKHVSMPMALTALVIGAAMAFAYS